MDASRISVIIPAYNEQSSISRCLDALLAQGDAIDEIVVIDNNSSDRTSEIVQQYASSATSVRLVTEHKQGALHAAARGVREATGDLVAKIDADTIIGDNWAPAVHRFFGVVPDTVAGGSGLCTMHDMPGQRPFRSMQAKMTARLSSALDKGEITSMQDSFGANFIMRAHVWRDIADHTSTRGDIQDDLDIGITVANRGWQLAWIPGMDAQISGRRLCTTPVSYWKYSARTPRTFRMHRRWGAWCKSLIGVQFARLAQGLAWPILHFWDPDTLRFAVRPNKEVQRVLP